MAALNQAIQDWGEPNPYALIRNFDSDALEHVLKIKELRAPPLNDWGVMLGDVLHNLRSTLDHLVCVLIRRLNDRHSCNNTGFPILIDEDLWDKRKKGRLAPNSGLALIGPLVDDTWAVLTIKGLQPFSRGKEAARQEPLYILNKLSNIDKHRTIHVGAFFLYSPEIFFDPPGSAEVVWIKPAGPFKNGDELLRYRLTRGPREGHVNTETTLGAEIVFDEGSTPAAGAKINVMLDWLFDTVVWVVDLFDNKFFGGAPPAGAKRSIVSAQGTVTTPIAGAHSTDPDAKRERWG